MTANMLRAIENFDTVTYRTNHWEYDTYGNYERSYSGYKCPDFTVSAKHSQGDAKHSRVEFEVFVPNRATNVSFMLDYNDALALRDMFSQVVATMEPDEPEPSDDN